jgi:hypothetical protein
MKNLIAHTEIVRAITQGRPRDLQVLAELISAGRDNEAAYHAWVEDRDHVHALSGTYLTNHLRDQLDACSLVDVVEHPQPARSPTRRSPSTRGGRPCPELRFTHPSPSNASKKHSPERTRIATIRDSVSPAGKTLKASSPTPASINAKSAERPLSMAPRNVSSCR